MDNVSSIALTTFGVFSALSGYLLWTFSTELQSLLGSLHDLNLAVPALKVGEKVIVSGVVSCITPNNRAVPMQSSYTKNPYAIQILIKETLNRCKNLLSLKSYKTNVNDFTIGLKANIPVKVVKRTLIHANKTFEKQEINNFSWGQSLRSFSYPFEFFTKFTEYIIPDKSFAFVQGELLKDSKGKLFIKASEISLHPDRFFSNLRERHNFAWKLFFISCLSFVLVLGYKYCLNSGNYRKTKIQCKDCGNSANVIVAPCMHLNLCKKCLLWHKVCKDCGQRINSFFNVTE